MSKVYDYILKHIIVNRFCIIPNWKWNIGPINTKKTGSFVFKSYRPWFCYRSQTHEINCELKITVKGNFDKHT